MPLVWRDKQNFSNFESTELSVGGSFRFCLIGLFSAASSRAQRLSISCGNKFSSCWLLCCCLVCPLVKKRSCVRLSVCMHIDIILWDKQINSCCHHRGISIRVAAKMQTLRPFWFIKEGKMQLSMLVVL